MDRKDWPWLGNRAAVQGYSTPLSCHHCEVTWEGCAAECCCPKCGAPKGYHTENHDACFCDECREEETPEPCTEAAREQGCSCRMSSVNSASIDPPHEIVDPWCPIHGGRDPDRERDERMDREAETE
jgi:hypothetical protein